MAALDGLRILDMTQYEAGPSATQALAWFGADVVKVEPPGRGDPARGGDHITPAYFMYWNSNKRSIVVDLTTDEGRELLLGLAPHFDVFVENYGPGVVDKLHVDYEAIKAVHPEVIYASVKGFGLDGPYSNRKCFDGVAQALAGALSVTGYADGPPLLPGPTTGDSGTGVQLALAILAAYVQKERTGEGQHIDLSQVEAGLVLCGPAILDKTVNDRSYRRPGNPPGNRAAWPKVAPHNTYRCQGDPKPASSWLMITCETHDQWLACAEALGHAEWATQDRFATLPARLRNQDELDALIGAITNHHDARALMEKLQAVGVPAGVVQDLPAVVHDDPQMQARGFTVENEHEVIGPHLTDGTPAHLSRTPAQRRAGGPLLGQDNDDILGDLLGYSEEERMELLINGALG